MIKKLLLPVLLLIVLQLSLAAQKVDSKAPAFSGMTPDNTKISLRDFTGNVVILDFWASWCKPCRKAMPFLVELYKENKAKGLEIIGVNLDSKKKRVDQFLNELGYAIPFPVILDPASKIPPIYDLKGMPTTVFIDKRGVIRFRHLGFSDTAKHKKQYRDELQLLLKE